MHLIITVPGSRFRYAQTDLPFFTKLQWRSWQPCKLLKALNSNSHGSLSHYSSVQTIEESRASFPLCPSQTAHTVYFPLSNWRMSSRAGIRNSASLASRHVKCNILYNLGLDVRVVAPDSLLTHMAECLSSPLTSSPTNCTKLLSVASVMTWFCTGNGSGCGEFNKLR